MGTLGAAALAAAIASAVLAGCAPSDAAPVQAASPTTVPARTTQSLLEALPTAERTPSTCRDVLDLSRTEREDLLVLMLVELRDGEGLGVPSQDMARRWIEQIEATCEGAPDETLAWAAVVWFTSPGGGFGA